MTGGRLSPPALASWAAMIGLCLALSAAMMVGIVRGLTAGDPPGDGAARLWPWTASDSLVLLARTVLVAIGIGTMATLAAIPASWALRRVPAGAVALLPLPMLMPPFLIHAAFSLLRAPGTWLGDRLEGGSRAQWALVNHAQAMASLALWSMPLAACLMAGATRSIERESLDVLELSGAGRWRRAVFVAGAIRPALIASTGVVALVMLGTAVPLHLAQVDTWSIVVWRSLAETGGSASTWLAALPLLAAGAAAGWFIGGRLADWTPPEGPGEHRDRRVGPGWLVGAGALWAIAVLGPPALFSSSLRSWRLLGSFWSMNAEPLMNSAVVGVVVAVLGGIVTLGVWAGLGDRESGLVHRITRGAVRALLIGALIPGVLVGAAIGSAGALRPVQWLTDSGAGLVFAHLIRFGAVAALAGIWLRRLEPRQLADSRSLYAGDSGVRSLGASLPLFVAPTLGAVLAVGLLSFHEIEAATTASPTGVPTFPQRTLALLHYLRDDELSASALVVSVVGLAVGLLAVALLSAPFRAALRRAAPCLALAVLCIGAAACDGRAAGSRTEPPERIIGSLGRGGGQFIYPRCIDSDGQSLWVIDKAARVQRIAFDGSPLFEFTMPRHQKGMPTGVTAGPDGLIYVADTHEHRVAVFDPGGMPGEVVREWGEYGFSAGQFVFPTDIAIVAGPDGRTPERFFVSEYGGNDRISVFDGDRRFLFAIGEPGVASESEGIVFSRPQSVAWDREGRRLIVADAANHRLGVFDYDGRLIRWIGRARSVPGSGLGEFCYPYGLAMLSDGSVLVSEFGNNRVQRVDLERGIGLSTLGSAGREAGSLVTPWGVAAMEERIFVLDSGNNRVQEFRAR